MRINTTLNARRKNLRICMYNYQSPNNSEPQIGVGLHPESAMGNFTTRNEINDEGKGAL